jgi:cytochrome b6-f complex iron-sulfur subunit
MKQIKKEHNTIELKGRRAFLSKSMKILGLVALGELAFFTFSLLKKGKPALGDEKTSFLKIIGAVEDFPKNSVTPDRINKFYLIRYEDGGFLALSLICSHLGCSVLWDETKKEFVCPCHSSAFDKLGNVMNSPAPRPLDYFPVLIEAGKVKIDISTKTKRKKFEKSQLTYAT